MAIRIEHLNYVYNAGMAFEKHAVRDVSLELPDGQQILLTDTVGFILRHDLL